MPTTKKFKWNFIVIPLITILTALLGSYFTSKGMSWYETTLIRPEITPPKIAFPIAWNIIFILTTISALITFNKIKKGQIRTFALILFGLNAILNVLWCYLFFGEGLILISLIEMMILEVCLLTKDVILWRESKIASLLLLPYTLWIAFATFLTWQIFILN